MTFVPLPRSMTDPCCTFRMFSTCGCIAHALPMQVQVPNTRRRGKAKPAKPARPVAAALPAPLGRR